MSSIPRLSIRLTKLSSARHRLSVRRVTESGAVEEDGADCDTRSFLVHDLLHFAVESEAATEHGIWGMLAAGKPLAALNERPGKSLAAEAAELLQIEQVVGVLTGAIKGATPAELLAGLRAQGEGLGWTLPAWLTEEFVVRVQLRVRRLLGEWQALAFGETMTIDWS